MSASSVFAGERAELIPEVLSLLEDLGTGKIHGVAYDTGWLARLSKRYPNQGFEAAVDWLRQNQHSDGSWGASLLHFHDRFASTLSAIVALREVSNCADDETRIKRGEAALWRLVSKLGRDDSDTVGFPIISSSLAQDAVELGLDVPRPPLRYAAAYKKKVDKLLEQPHRDWRTNALSFSLEGLWRWLGDDDIVLEQNHSVACSPAATAAYLMRNYHHGALEYLKKIQEADGSVPALAPIDVYDIVWSLSNLRTIEGLDPALPRIQQLLEYLWELWSPTSGLYYSKYFKVADLDNTSAGFILLRWGGYPVTADCFEYYEMDDHFCTYKHESNPSPSAHLRLLLALQQCPEHPKQQAWLQKTLNALRRFDENGSFWWDKWHASPYYVSDLAVKALVHVDPELAASRLKWILKTQNDSGGWGYLGKSTFEETAYCINALLTWSRMVEPVDPEVLERAARFLRSYRGKRDYTPLWISKGLYAPRNIVKSVILSAQFQLVEQ